MWSLADLAVNWPERVEDLKVTHSIRVQWTAQVIFLSFWDKKSEKFMNFKLVFDIWILLKMLGRNVRFSWSFSLSPPDWFSSFNNGKQCLINLNQSKASPISIQTFKEYNWINIYNYHKSIILVCALKCTAWKLRLE